MRCFFSLLVCFSMFAQSTSSFATAVLSGATVIFPISPASRGADLVVMLSTLMAAPYKTPVSQVALQTTMNGLIPNVQSLTPATNSTLLIVGYKPGSLVQYIVIPVEQISEMVYSPVAIPSTTFTTSPVAKGGLPIFSVDLSQRATDLQNVISTLTTSSPYKTSVSQVGLQTVLTGPFYWSISGGFIPNVQSISLTANGTLMLVTYKPGYLPATIIVAPEQVYGVVYTSS